MRITPNYQFKIKELKDSPPDITVGEENWEKIETELIEINNSIELAANKFDFEAWANMPGAIYNQTKTTENIYVTTLEINSVKKAERSEYPQNEQGEYITVEIVYKHDGSVESTRTMKEYKVGDDWKVEVI